MKKYELHAEVLNNKYGRIIQGFEKACDDRRVAWNCYQQLITACGAMNESDMANSFVCCAVNDAIRQQEAEIDEIITRFTGLFYVGSRWLPEEEAIKERKREEIRRAVYEASDQEHGGFVNTDGEWCACTTPESFGAFIRSLGFSLESCVSEPGVTAIARTTGGIMICWNGYCKREA